MKESITIDPIDCSKIDSDDFIIETNHPNDSSETNSIKTATTTIIGSDDNLSNIISSCSSPSLTNQQQQQQQLSNQQSNQRSSSLSSSFRRVSITSNSSSYCQSARQQQSTNHRTSNQNKQILSPNNLTSTTPDTISLSSASALPPVGYNYQSGGRGGVGGGKYHHGSNSLPTGNYVGRKASIVMSNLRRSSVQVVISVWTSFRGIFFAFLSAIFFSITSAIVKHLSDIHPGVMSLFRFIGILLFSIPMVTEVGARNILGPRNLRLWVLLRGVAGATSVYLRYCALQYLPIANATIIVLSMPVFVCILARVFLKEPCGVFHVIALAVTLLGIAFTAKLNVIFGSSEEEAADAGIDKTAHLLGLAAGMGATLVGSSSYVIVRKVKSLDQSVILFNFAWVAIIETSVLTYFQDGFALPTTIIGTWLLVLLTIASFYAQFLLTKALKCEEAGLVSVTRASSEVILAFLMQIFIFQSMPDWYSYVGAFLVTTAVSMTSVRKYIVTLPKDSTWRRIFAFTLK
ncbi:pseudopaline exporter CntI-like [Panonychus citri]|uniref:pseudopaline exporter CntI-like n=1 Tax=Panonychus citri TaxID=50023 RepID=UPI0023070718|nr:pseudopaline exporter CntI-like [Panonychus citri]